MIENIISELQNGNLGLFVFLLLTTTLPIFIITFINLKKYLKFYNYLVEYEATSPDTAIVYDEAHDFFKRRFHSGKVSAIKFDEADKAWADTKAMKWTVIRVLLELPLVLFLLTYLLIAVYYRN